MAYVQLALFPLASPREEARQQWRQHMRDFDRDRLDRRQHGLQKRHAQKLAHLDEKAA